MRPLPKGCIELHTWHWRDLPEGASGEQWGCWPVVIRVSAIARIRRHQDGCRVTLIGSDEEHYTSETQPEIEHKMLSVELD